MKHEGYLFGFDGQLALPSKPVTLTLFKSGVRSGLNYYRLFLPYYRKDAGVAFTNTGAGTLLVTRIFVV
jgi:hypothetical protein